MEQSQEQKVKDNASHGRGHIEAEEEEDVVEDHHTVSTSEKMHGTFRENASFKNGDGIQGKIRSLID